MREHQTGASTQVLQLDGDLGRRGVVAGHAQLRGRQHVAVLVGHRLGVDQAPLLDDLAVLAGEPHPHRSVVRGHGDPARTPSAHPSRRGSLTGLGAARPIAASRKWSGSVHIRQTEFATRTRSRSRTRWTTAPTSTSAISPGSAHRPRRGLQPRRVHPSVRGRLLRALGVDDAVGVLRSAQAAHLGHANCGFMVLAPTGRIETLLELTSGLRSRTGRTGPGHGPVRPTRCPPQCSSTRGLMCFETAGRDSSNGSASSLTLAGLSASRARIARRVELASAAKVSLSRSSSTVIVMPVTFHIG